MMLRQSFFLFGFIFLFTDAKAQKEGFLNYFIVSEYEGGAFLTWQISKGSFCFGVNVLRSIDSISFTKIGEISGICGNIEKPADFSFLDSKPEMNKKVFYRLELGRDEFSNTIATKIIDAAKGYIILPNPISHTGKIYFSNELNQQKLLKVFDLSGKIIHQVTGKEDYFDIYAADLTSCKYIFTITNVDNSLTSKGTFIISK